MSLGRAITHHHVGVEELDIAYEITALDKPEPMSKCYRVNALASEPGHQSINTFNIQFQDDDPKILGHNGLSDDVLLAILIDRAHCAQLVDVEEKLLGAMWEMRHATLKKYQKKRE